MSKSNNRKDIPAKVEPLRSLNIYRNRAALPPGEYVWIVGLTVNTVKVKRIDKESTVITCRTEDLRMFFAGLGSVEVKQ